MSEFLKDFNEEDKEEENILSNGQTVHWTMVSASISKAT